MYRILCYGDSNTWAYSPSLSQRYPFEKRWTSILQQKLGTAANELLPEPKKALKTERVSVPSNVATSFPTPTED